jgi:hypothetical protein
MNPFSDPEEKLIPNWHHDKSKEEYYRQDS